MKVLIVLGGDAPGVELLKACADEADFSIAADRGLEAFDAAGLEPGICSSATWIPSRRTCWHGTKAGCRRTRLNCIENDTDCRNTR